MKILKQRSPQSFYMKGKKKKKRVRKLPAIYIILLYYLIDN